MNTYGYVTANPVNRFDLLGLVEKCITGFLGIDWKEISTAWKTVRYKDVPFGARVGESIADAISMIKPGIFAPKRIPIRQEVRLEQAWFQEYTVCWDECGNLTRKVPTGPTKKGGFREVFMNPTNTKDGGPVLFFGQFGKPDMSQRWSMEISNATGNTNSLSNFLNGM